MLGMILAMAIANGATASEETAIRDAENRWSAAYVTGDAAYLASLLTEDYVSVGETGISHPKADIISGAVKYAKSHPGEAATPMPASSTISVSGDLALVRHRDAEHVSVDVFQKLGGAWRALYSQHTHATSPAA